MTSSVRRVQVRVRPSPRVSFTRLRVTVLAVIALLAAGCATAPDPSGEPGEGEQTYWLVQVRGNETHEPPPGSTCSVAFDHRLTPNQQRLNYSAHRYNFTDPAFVIAFDVWDESTHCPIAYKLEEGTSDVAVELGRYGNVTFTPNADGSIHVGAAAADVELGPQETFEETYEDTYEDEEGRQVNVTGQFVVDHLGEWPTDRMRAEGG